MKGLVMTAVILSLVVLAAHFLRSGNFAFVFICLAMVWVAFQRAGWARRSLQVVLTLGLFEWMRALLTFVERRIDAGEPWERLAIIIGSVAAVAAAAVIGLEARALRERFASPSRETPPE